MYINRILNENKYNKHAITFELYEQLYCVFLTNKALTKYAQRIRLKWEHWLLIYQSQNKKY